MAAITTYARAGGLPPADDERLEIDGDGSWRLWRTMGGARVGAFGGRLSADRRRRLASALEAAGDAAPSRVAALPRPDAAHEAFRAGRRSLDVTAGAAVSGGWAGLVRLLRRWSESLASAAEAETALELEVAAGGPLLVRRGPAGLRIWPSTLHVDLYARDADGIVVDRASQGPGASGDVPRGEALTTPAGWVLALDLPRAVTAPAAGRIEAWAWLDIDGPEGRVRVRMVATRPT